MQLNLILTKHKRGKVYDFNLIFKFTLSDHSRSIWLINYPCSPLIWIALLHTIFVPALMITNYNFIPQHLIDFLFWKRIKIDFGYILEEREKTRCRNSEIGHLFIKDVIELSHNQRGSQNFKTNLNGSYIHFLKYLHRDWS